MTNTVKLPGTDPKRVGMVTLDMRSLDRKNEDGKTICDIPKLVKAEVRAGLEDVLHRKSVSFFSCLYYHFCIWILLAVKIKYLPKNKMYFFAGDIDGQ